jgi:hypothetical protein
MAVAILLLLGGVAHEARADGTIRIGILSSLSGTMMISETILKDQMLTQVAELNAHGGLLDNKAVPSIEYLMSDEGGAVKRWVLEGTDYVYPRRSNKVIRAFLHSKDVSDADSRDTTPIPAHAWTTPATIASTASWSRTSTSMPKAVPPAASLSATVLSSVISLASASNSSKERKLRSATATCSRPPSSSRYPPPYVLDALCINGVPD